MCRDLSHVGATPFIVHWALASFLPPRNRHDVQTDCWLGTFKLWGGGGGGGAPRHDFTVCTLRLIEAHLFSALFFWRGGILCRHHRQGRRIAGIYMLSDDGNRHLHMEGNPVHAPEGALVLFEGDRLRHSVPPRSKPGMRLVVNMVWCERPCVRKSSFYL